MIQGKNMSIRTDIKTILAENDMSITNLAKLMTEASGKYYSQSNISQKLLRGTLKFEEAKLIGTLLGYELKYIRTKSYMN